MRLVTTAAAVVAVFVLVPVTSAQTTTIPTKRKPASMITTNSTPPDSTPADPVSVVNLPTDETGALKVSEQGNNATPKPVIVTNFPAVQAVEGTVNVGNLPAEQVVAGTVEVGNLPLAEDGSVRVTVGGGPASQIINVLDAPVVVPPGGRVEFPPISTAGYKSFGIWVDAPASYAAIQFDWRWSADDPFSSVVDNRLGNVGAPGVNGFCNATPGQRYLCNVVGNELRITYFNNAPYSSFTVSVVKIYLFS